MSRTYYQIYKEQTFVLARTLIVKHEEIASSMNTELYYRGYAVDSNPYNWRYYLNLSGEYHQADKDELAEKYGTQYMMVKVPSLLGSVDVPLTKELLHGSNADKTMMNEYQIGSKFYEELVSRYPEFESLIIGIINPIEKEVALAADNGEILFIAGRYKRIEGDRKWFDTTWYSINEVLIEEQEDNLILELQRYITHFLKHWSNPEYVNGNDLYIVTMLGILYANIPNVLFNIRLGNCKTARAHTFHIRQYLESFGQIGRYVDFIPIGTILWLYKNVHYLEANAGKQHAFDLMMDNMLTPNEIPMSAYTARHELSAMDYDNPLPNAMLYKEVLNFSIVGASDDDRTVLDILEDQKDLARDNAKDLDEKAQKIQTTLNWGGDDRLNTKVLESEMIDIGEPYPFTLSQMLFNHWGYTAIKGYYTGTAYATNPLTGDRLSFNSKNAYILAMYCLNKAVAGVTLERIPSVRLYGIPRTDQPDDYPTDKRFHKKPDIEKMMSWCVAGVTRRLKVLEVRGTHIPNFYAQDSEQFFDNTEEIYLERIRRYNTYCDVENLEERGDLELVAKRLYWLGFEEKIIDADYESWFRTIGFDVSRFTDTDLLGIGLELVASATGVSEQDDVRKKWLQKSLLAILKHFVSYTVHVIEKYTDGVVAYLEGQTLRFSNFEWTYTEPVKSYYNVSLDYKTDTLLKQAMRIDVSNIFENTKVKVDTKSEVGFDMSNFDVVQRAHRLHSDRYILGTKIFNIEFNTEKAEPIYITVIDESINTIVVHSVFGQTRDENFIHVMKPDVSYVKPYGIRAHQFDTVRTAQFKDNVQNGLAIDGVSASLTEDGLRTKGRYDNGVVTPHAMFASSVDDSITGIGFIDTQAVMTVSPSGASYDSLDSSGLTEDQSGVLASAISAGMSDTPISLNEVSSDSINLSNMVIGFMDPAIPGIMLPIDNAIAQVGSICGDSRDTVIDIEIVDRNTLINHSIGVNSTEEEFEPIPSYDTHATGVTNISASVGDHIDLEDILDSHMLSILPVSITVVDDVPNTASVLDSEVVSIHDVHASIIDSASAIVEDVSTIMAGDISAYVTDDNTNVSVISDDMVTVTNIHARSTDLADTEIIDTLDSLAIRGITMSYVDGVETIANTHDASTLMITDVKVDVREIPVSVNVVDSQSVNIQGVAARLIDSEIYIDEVEHNTTILNNDLIKVEVNDDDYRVELSDTHVVSHNSISGQYVDHPLQSETIENSTSVITGMQLRIVGESVHLNPLIDSTAVGDPSSRTVITLTDYKYHQLPVGVDSVLSGNIHGYLKDVTLNDVSAIDKQQINIQLNTLSLNNKDSDTMLDDTDNSVIGVTGIQIKLVDESDDSKPNP